MIQGISLMDDDQEMTFTCNICGKKNLEIGACSFNIDTAFVKCVRCDLTAKGQNIDYAIMKVKELIESAKRRRLPRARMELGKARKRGNSALATTWQDEINRLNELIEGYERKLKGLNE